MVFDTSFRKLGEQFLGDAYQVNSHFVSPDGIINDLDGGATFWAFVVRIGPDNWSSSH